MYNIKKTMTKKAWKDAQKVHRVTNGFNTGTRTMKTVKNPTRAMSKENFQKILDNYLK